MAYKVFICHAYDHRDIYFDLIRKLNDVKGFNWRNLSVQYDMRLGADEEELDTEELRSEIGQRIADCDVLLALTKPVASRRQWLQWEIARASDLGTPVIGIARRRNDRVSAFVRRHADDIVDTWRVDHIINAIKLYAEDYRERQKTHGQLNLPSLPNSTPDEELEPEPTPEVPDDLAADHATRPERILPRDVLGRELGAVIPGQLFAPETRQPRWWWPFSQRK